MTWHPVFMIIVALYFLYLHVLRRLHVDIYHLFILFFSLIFCSVAALNNWIVSTIHFFAFVKCFRKHRFFRKNRFINNWIWWLISKVYFLWMEINNDASSTIKIFDLFETTSLFHFFNDSLPPSFNTYQDMRNVAFEKANISLYYWTKSFYKLIQSVADNTTTTLIIYHNVSN